MSNNKQLHSNQAGMVSFMVTLVMIMVITLIVLGFAQVSRRTDRESLDKLLSAQAFYAAESGINVTKEKLVSYLLGGGTDPGTKTACVNDYDPSDSAGSGAPITALDSDVSYTCVLVDPAPQNLSYNVSQSGSAIVPINATSPIAKLKFSWPTQQGMTAGTCTAASDKYYPPLAQWACGYGVIKVELTRTAGVLFDSTNLAAATTILYLSPQGGHSGTLDASAGGARVYTGSASGCATTCQVEVTLPVAATNYYARITSVYRDAPGLSITGTLTTNGPVKFIQAQAVVDVTGKAQDQLRRIQARLSVAPVALSNNVPLAALSSGGPICKHFTILPSDSVNTADVCN